MPRPFLGSTSDLTRQQLRARRYERLSRDVYVADGAPAHEDACDAVLLALPGCVLSHCTAGLWWRLPVRRERAVHVTRAPDRQVCKRDGVVTHRARLHPDDVDLCRGRPVTALGRTFVDLAATSSFTSLVAVGDVVLRRVGRPALEAAVARGGRRKGVVLARAALPVLDPGAASPAESRARLLLRDAGFADLRHAVVVRDSAGQWVCEADLGDEAARVAVQYDGDVHFSSGPAQRRADVARDELARLAGWEVAVLTRDDLRHEHLAVMKVRAAYERAELRQRGRLAG